MRITTVEYRELVSDGNFGNRTVGAVAEVHENETPLGVLEKLRTWVKSQLDVECGNCARLEKQSEDFERDLLKVREVIQRSTVANTPRASQPVEQPTPLRQAFITKPHRDDIPF